MSKADKSSGCKKAKSFFPLWPLCPPWSAMGRLALHTTPTPCQQRPTGTSAEPPRASSSTGTGWPQEHRAWLHTSLHHSQRLTRNCCQPSPKFLEQFSWVLGFFVPALSKRYRTLNPEGTWWCLRVIPLLLLVFISEGTRDPPQTKQKQGEISRELLGKYLSLWVNFWKQPFFPHKLGSKELWLLPALL